MRTLLFWSLALAAAASPLRAQREGSRQYRFTVGGSVTFSSPALSRNGDTAYIGVETQSGGRVVAVSTFDGANRWQASLPMGLVLPDPVESSPVVAADGTIYIGGGNGSLYRLNPVNGAIIWERPLAPGWFIGGAPAIGTDGTIYVGAGDGRLYAYDESGFQKWVFGTDGIIDSSPAIAPDGTIYFGSNDRHLYAVTNRGDRGELKWRHATGGIIFSSPAIGADGTVYVGSVDQRMYAFAPDGTKKWDYFTNGPIYASPTLGADGTIYFAADRSFYALRPDDSGNRVRWIVDIGTSSISSAAIRGDGAIIFGADDGLVRALNPTNGSLLWPPFNTETGDLIESSPIVGPDGSIYVGSQDGHLYKINGNGSPLSRYSSWPAFRRDTRHTAQVVPPPSGGELANISTRAQAGGGRNLIAGFVVQAPRGRAYLVRGIGPGLASRVAGFMPDPFLELYRGLEPVPIRANDNWFPRDQVSNFSLVETSDFVQAFALESGSKDAAILPGLPSGIFTARVNTADDRPGVALVEVYDVRDTDRPARLLNLSTRGFVGTGDDILIAGFVVGGTGPMRLLLRGIGPGLSQFNVSGVLQQPRISVFSGTTQVATNTHWTTDGYKGDLIAAGASVGAFTLAEGRTDSALLFDAQPGPYTIQISGVGETTGEALVEIYVLP